MPPSKSRVPFGICFLALTTAAALLLTWSLWWLIVIGSSVPARRPFYNTLDQLPDLIAEAAELKTSTVFEFALSGGWPSSNSIVRLLASLVAVGASFSFSYVAALASDRFARVFFVAVLGAVAALGFVAFAMDAAAIANAGNECKARKCVTAVPQAIIDAGSICQCSVDAWFYLTLVVDIVLVISAVSCLVLAGMPLFRRNEISNETEVTVDHH